VFLHLAPSGRNTDFILECEGEEFAVHRIILEARSPVFRGMLECSMTESQAGRCVVRDVIKPVLPVLLHFIYTGMPAPLRSSVCYFVQSLQLLQGLFQAVVLYYFSYVKCHAAAKRL
jgi:hypothetical protein